MGGTWEVELTKRRLSQTRVKVTTNTQDCSLFSVCTLVCTVHLYTWTYMYTHTHHVPAPVSALVNPFQTTILGRGGSSSHRLQRPSCLCLLSMDRDKDACSHAPPYSNCPSGVPHRPTHWPCVKLTLVNAGLVPSLPPLHPDFLSSGD